MRNVKAKFYWKAQRKKNHISKECKNIIQALNNPQFLIQTTSLQEILVSKEANRSITGFQIEIQKKHTLA